MQARASGVPGEAGGDVRPRALALELTKGCNLRCGYCYYAEREDAYQPATKMSPEVARQSVDRLLAEGSEGPLHLHFFGGEPLLNVELLEETVHYAERRARQEGRTITFEVTTNGTRLTEAVVAFLNEHRVRVGVSFDGPPEIQDRARPAPGGASGARGSYAMAAPGIRRLCSSRRGTELEPLTHASVVLTRASTDIVGIVAHLEGLGFPKVIVTPATDLAGKSNGFREEDLPDVLAAYGELADDYERRVASGGSPAETWFPTLMGRLLSGERRLQFCGGGRDYLGVAADGKLHLCYRFFEDEEFAMGSVQEGIERGVTRRLEALPLDERTRCSSCWARYFCGGGCHHENVTVGGGLADPNPVTCEVFRYSMGRTLEAWARLSRKGVLPGRASPEPKAARTGPGENKPMSERDDAAESPYGLDDRPRAVQGAHVRDLEEERLVYEPVSHELVVLNRTAAFILDRCDGERTVGELFEALRSLYDAPEERLRADLLATLEDLRARRLVT